MDIHFCVVTWNQAKQLGRLYDSLRASWGKLTEDNFLIVNNHPNFKKPGRARVIHNTLRPPESIGYLSRSWNQCILQAFGKMVAPKHEWVALVQSDVVFRPGWRQRFERHFRETGDTFVACGPGDQVVFIHHSAFSEIGWWDERFSAIGYQEFDYFLRAILRLPHKAAVEGHDVNLRWRWPEDLALIERQAEDGSGHTSKINPQLLAHLMDKWGQYFIEATCLSFREADTYASVLERRFGPADERAENQFKEPLPLEYNWYPHFYKDDTIDRSPTYYGYTQLRGDLDIKVHGFG